MSPDPGLQTWHDAIHLISFVRGDVAAATHCGLVLPVTPEDLSGRQTCAACFNHWIETEDAGDVATAPDPVRPPALPSGAPAATT